MADDVRLSFLSWLAQQDTEREQGYRLYREYYDGDHDTQLTDRMRKYLQVKSHVEFRANYCPIVVDALAERLNITGITAEDQSAVLWGWWTAGRLDGLQVVLHTAAPRDGDAYVLVEWDAETLTPKFFFEPAFDGGDGVQVVYDDATNTPSMAIKRWRAKSGPGAGYLRRINVYYPDRVEKYVSSDKDQSGQWQKFKEDNEAWPMPWLRADGRPMGIPIVHYKNRDQGTNYGQSELKDVLPLQNALNKAVIDLLAAADTTAFRIYWMLGDDPSAVSVSPGSWVYSTKPPSGDDAASLGYFPGEDLANLIGLKDSLAIEIARVSRTPVSYFQVSGQRPAEGTLKQEESGLVGRARARMVSFGNAWEDAFGIARKMWNEWGDGDPLDEAVPITIVWKDPETRNDKALLETLKIKADLGVPKQQLWTEMGYSADEIEHMQEMVDEEQSSQADLGETLLNAFEKAPRMAATGQMPPQMPAQATEIAQAEPEDEMDGDGGGVPSDAR
jgi:hypothetical protein